MPETGGPYLIFAALCERVLREHDDVVSLIRIVDRFDVSVQAVVPSGTEEPTLGVPIIPITLAIGLKAGGAAGTKQLTVSIETPSGFRLPETSASIVFNGGEDPGSNLFMPMQFPAQDDGVYWFVISLDGRLLTKTPLRINKLRVQTNVPPRLP